MPDKPKVTKLTWEACRYRAGLLPTGKAYGVPRGGVYAALLHGNIADTPEEADFIIDDIVDSGGTRDRWLAKHGKPFYALVDKTTGADAGLGWIQFPWEAEAESDVKDSVTRLLQFIGEDPTREGLLDTPKRVVKAWREMTEGYWQHPAEILATSFDGAGYDEMVVCRDIEFVSVCEHHMLPFTGLAHVAYIPKQRVVGLSKMARLVDCFARRLQIQEKMTRQIADSMQIALDPQGVGVIVQARHSCMACRGVRKQNASMVTTALTGAFREHAVRDEFFAHTK